MSEHLVTEIVSEQDVKKVEREGWGQSGLKHIPQFKAWGTGEEQTAHEAGEEHTIGSNCGRIVDP